jgi:hypothetical protein
LRALAVKLGGRRGVGTVRFVDPIVLNSKSRAGLVLGAAYLLAACGATSQAKVKDEQVVRLPVEERQALLVEQQNVDVAKSNVDAAYLGVTEAQQFRAIVGNEIDAAKARRSAAEKELELAGQQGDAKRMEGARERLRLGDQYLTAANTKGEYAENLLTLRQAQRDERQAEYDYKKAQLEQRKYQSLAAEGMAGKLDRTKFQKKAGAAELDVADARRRVSEADAKTDASQQVWDQARHQFEADARRANVADIPITAPPPPEPAAPQPAAKQLQPKQEP